MAYSCLSNIVTVTIVTMMVIMVKIMASLPSKASTRQPFLSPPVSNSSLVLSTVNIELMNLLLNSCYGYYCHY